MKRAETATNHDRFGLQQELLVQLRAAGHEVVKLRHEPAVLVLSRQPLPILNRTKYAPASGVARGAYVLADASCGKPEILLIATSSELGLAVQAHEQLSAEDIRSRVVSMPSWEIYVKQSQEYRNSVLPPELTARVAI